VSVVVPCYGCESCLRALYAELLAALPERFELILVDDLSKPPSAVNVTNTPNRKEPSARTGASSRQRSAWGRTSTNTGFAPAARTRSPSRRR
jgi:hypothetical protein